MAEVEALSYTNFKSHVTKTQGRERQDAYMRVWSVLRGMKD